MVIECSNDCIPGRNDYLVKLINYHLATLSSKNDEIISKFGKGGDAWP